ncbi:hypothetical protein [Chitinophaga niabensis]|uniref:Uncharacterized protein n=1 Tax=Chitinophaga niabensis TaxID=536979 RepID=A0A1N6KBL3_9BACT|nr:hypothetical protein [Chitinophaga niabensis]SIO53931.1 hypothetical protein SAMN04488055_5507 [Chitinophaga niabensis]
MKANLNLTKENWDKVLINCQSCPKDYLISALAEAQKKCKKGKINIGSNSYKEVVNEVFKIIKETNTCDTYGTLLWIDQNGKFKISTGKMREGYRSPKYGHLGLYFLSTGPDPNGPMPGTRVIMVIYDDNDMIVRRLEEVRGECLDPGYIDFFNSHLCKSALYQYHIIDVDINENVSILASHTEPSEANKWLKINVPTWIEKHGIKQ